MRVALAALVLLLMVGETGQAAPAPPSRAERQAHWELGLEFEASSTEVLRLISFCTHGADDVEDFLHYNLNIFRVSFQAVVRSYETPNTLWADGFRSFSAFSAGWDRAGEFTDKVTENEGLTDTELCQKLLWVRVAELEDVSTLMMRELQMRKMPYVQPLGLSRVWKSSTTNTWQNSVAEPYANMRRLFDANPYRKRKSH